MKKNEIPLNNYRSLLHSVLSRSGVNDNQERKDIIQTVFLNFLGSNYLHNTEQQLIKYLILSANNTRINVWRKRTKKGTVQKISFQEKEFAIEDRNDYDMEYFEFEKIILSSIDDLSNELMTTIKLRSVDGMSYEEISKIMKIPIGTVKARIFRARSILRKKLSGEVDEKLICYLQ